MDKRTGGTKKKKRRLRYKDGKTAKGAKEEEKIKNYTHTHTHTC